MIMKKLLTVLLFVTISLGAYSQTIQFENIKNNGSNVEAELYLSQASTIYLYVDYKQEGMNSGGWFELAGTTYLKGNQDDYQMIQINLAPGVHKFGVHIYEHSYMGGRAYGQIYLATASGLNIGPNNTLTAEFEYN